MVRMWERKESLVMPSSSHRGHAGKAWGGNVYIVTLTKFFGGHQCTLGHGPARDPIVWASQSPFPLQQRWTYPPCPHTRLALIECLSWFLVGGDKCHLPVEELPRWSWSDNIASPTRACAICLCELKKKGAYSLPGHTVKTSRQIYLKAKRRKSVIFRNHSTYSTQIPS